MNRLIRFAANVGAACLALAAPAGLVQLNGHNFLLPDGFDLTVAAAPPLVERPLMAAFDERGRLCVADAAASNTPAARPTPSRAHRVLRLEDTDGDGRFERHTVFADQMALPRGVLWHEGSLYVGAPPSIWRLEDTDDDGVADRRVEWFKGTPLSDCANEVFGPFAGPDGWLYWGQGAATGPVRPASGSPVVDAAARLSRCRLDGSAPESILTGGMEGPLALAFLPEADAVLAATRFTASEVGRRDALLPVLYGAVYPRSAGDPGGFERAGRPLPVLNHLGPVAPWALARCGTRALGAEFEGNLFSTAFNGRAVLRHILEVSGSTFKTTNETFLISDHLDFHPTGVLEDADGSLLILDTGGWYTLCWPDSPLAKPDALGAIYRVRRKGAPSLADPRGLRLDWSALGAQALAKLLGDDRPAVRQRAVTHLARLGAQAVPALAETVKSADSPEAQRNAVWALHRLDGAPAREAVRAAFAKLDPSVRQAAAHSVGLHRDPAALPQLTELLKYGSPHLQRAAAVALGRIGNTSAVPALLAAAASPVDGVLEHSLIYALIELGGRESTAAGLQASSPLARRAALIALDAMKGGGLKSGDVVPLLASPEPVLQETAAWLADRHPEWDLEVATVLREGLSQTNWSAPARDTLRRLCTHLAGRPAVQRLLAETARSANSPEAARRLALQAMAAARLDEMPALWVEALAACLADPSQTVAREALAVVAARPASGTTAMPLNNALAQLGRAGSRPADLRLAALRAIQPGLTNVEPVLFDFLRGHLASATPWLTRANAARVLGHARLDDAQLLALSGDLKAAGPLEVWHLIHAFESVTNEPVGRKLLAALKETQGVAGVRIGWLRTFLTNAPPAVQQAGRELLGLLNVDFAQQAARLEGLLVGLKPGDARRGEAVYHSTKAACATCHLVGDLGGRVGSDLTRIGADRTARDLLESLLYPSVNLTPGYEPMIVTTKDDEEFSGVMREEPGGLVVLINANGAAQRFVLADLQELRPGMLSVMPEGLEQQLTPQELADLLAFLQALK